jgi:hypothetical protein
MRACAKWSNAHFPFPLALQTISATLNPIAWLKIMAAYVEHKNPKVRGKAGAAAAIAVSRIAPAEVVDFGIAKLLKLAGQQLTDNTPEARDSARSIVGKLRMVCSDPAVMQQLNVVVPEPEVGEEGEEAQVPPTEWEVFCRMVLSPSAAMAALKIF